MLYNATRQQIDRKSGEVNLLYFDSYPFDMAFYSNKEDTRARKSDELYINELLNPDPTLDKKTRNKQIADGHSRLTWPLNNLSMPFMVMAIMLSGDYNRRGQSKRIITCIIIAIALIVSGFALKNLAARGKDFFLVLMYVPSVLTALISLYILAIGKNPLDKPIPSQQPLAKGAG
jgi:lipopolysaccharide export system permease protein